MKHVLQNFSSQVLCIPLVKAYDCMSEPSVIVTEPNREAINMKFGQQFHYI